jgi:dTDP-4-amino-4,6-dideoxygalactose transaminase
MAQLQRATYGPASFEKYSGGVLPSQFPRTIGPNAIKYLQEVVEGGLGSTAMLERFERAFAKEYGVRHFIATPGCTPALAVLAAAFGFEPGDEIIVSPVTDYGTLQGLIRENYIPVFADTLPGTVIVGADTIAACITSRTRAILVVHKTGTICDMDAINALAERRGLIVYEDACQAVFGEYKGRLAGTLSRAAGFSFDSEKTMGSDVGGGIATNDDELAEQIRFIGQSRGAVQALGFGRQHSEPGFAHRMPLCTAALCLAQLEIIRDQVACRDKMIRLLSNLVSEIPGVHPLPIPEYMNVYSAWMFSFNINPDLFRCRADEFAEQLVQAGIETGPD